MVTSVMSVKIKKKLNSQDVMFRFMMLLPAFLILGVFMFYPIVEAFRLSFTRTTGLMPGPYIGIQNYVRLIANEDFRLGFIHVFQWAFWSILIQIPLQFFIAYACTNYKNGLTKKLKVINYLGGVMPIAVVSLLSLFIIMPQNGIVATFAKLSNMQSLAVFDFIGDPKHAFWTLFVIASWAYLGFGIIYFMANIEQIPTELIEAAVIDGASKPQLAYYVVIPQISYAIRIQALLSAVGSIKLFDLPWIVATGGPINATTTLGIELYKQGLVNMQYGKGAAIGVVIFLLCLALTIIQFSIKNDSD